MQSTNFNKTYFCLVFPTKGNISQQIYFWKGAQLKDRSVKLNV